MLFTREVLASTRPDSCATYHGVVSAAGDLQAVVDDVAGRLGLSVLVEDTEFQALSWSVQVEVDDVRLQTILRRGVHPAAVAMVHDLGLAQATEPVRTPAVPDAGMQARWCAPLRKGRRLLGFMWVLDPNDEVDASGFALVLAAAERSSALLAERPADANPRRILELVRRLENRRDLESARTLAALVGLPDDVLVVADAAPRSGGWSLSGGLIAYPAHEDHRNATSGRPVPLAELGEAARRARMTLQAIAAGAVLRTPSWDDLRTWRFIVDAPESLTPADLHAGADLLRGLKRQDLLTTARIFLELGADAAATSSALHLHRTTLYYRLDRIAALTGTDLRSDPSRQDLDLALRLAAFRAVASSA